MNELPKEYAMVHIYAATKAREPIVIKGNTSMLVCACVFALISAIAFSDGTAEIFSGDAELYEVVVRLVNTHEELSPLPDQNLQP
jgi:predicted Co/Zn/Cd cation transporter (cation efflux family)